MIILFPRKLYKLKSRVILYPVCDVWELLRRMSRNSSNMAALVATPGRYFGNEILAALNQVWLAKFANNFEILGSKFFLVDQIVSIY